MFLILYLENWEFAASLIFFGIPDKKPNCHVDFESSHFVIENILFLQLDRNLTKQICIIIES